MSTAPVPGKSRIVKPEPYSKLGGCGYSEAVTPPQNTHLTHFEMACNY
jgi:hypothetical protein